MSKTVTIPTDGMNPFVVMHNGEKYVYTPGATVEVPDGVALEIEEYKRWREKYYGDNVPPFENANALGDITAEVGQTIVVKSVDENGKPTEWEAVDKANEIMHGRVLAAVNFTEDTTGVTITDINADVTELTLVWVASTGSTPPKVTINNHSWEILGGGWVGIGRMFIKIDKKSEKAYMRCMAANGGSVSTVTAWGKDEIVESINLSSLVFASGNTFIVYEGLSALLTAQRGNVAPWLP